MINPVKPTARQILEVRPETGLEFTIKVTNEVQPDHGQFFQLSIPRVGEAPISVSAFGDGWLEFTIREVGKVTDKISSLKKGDEIFLRGAYGKGWPVEELKGKHLVVIAGGTGLAPVKSLLNHYAKCPDEILSLDLICGFKNSESILFKSSLDQWKEKFRTIYTLDNESAPGFETGLVTKFVEKIPFSSFDNNYAVLIVGPPVMMHFTALECLKNGVPEDKIWVSFERKMSCAIGKCGHCRIDETYVCLEGPVFNYTVAKGLLD